MGLESLLPAVAGAAVTVLKGILGTDKPQENTSSENKSRTFSPEQLAAFERLQRNPRPKD